MRHALCAAALMIACDRGRPRDETPAAAPAPTAAAAASVPPAPAAPGCTLAPVPLRMPAPRRLIAIGDLHGDLTAARAALRTGGAIDEHDRWIGGDLVVVQTGDVLDRGDDERAILDLIARLETEARAAGGAVVALLGNHELMNVAGDFRYVTAAGMHAFDAPDEAIEVGGPTGAAGGAGGNARRGIAGVAPGRLAALGPGGPYAHRLAQHAVIAIVGDTVFSHAGVIGSWVSRVEEVNRSSRCWIDGQSAAPPDALRSDDSPLWTRAIGRGDADCAAVAAALPGLGVKRMVVGHTIQPTGITSACDGAVWRIDVGMSRRADGGGPIEVLEIAAGAPPKILRGER